MQKSAWIRYYFKIDPYSLSEDDFELMWKEAHYLLKVMKPIKAE
jgi:hypothetical protein